MTTRYFVPWSAYQATPHDALDHLEGHGKIVRVVLDRNFNGGIAASAEIEKSEAEAGEEA